MSDKKSLFDYVSALTTGNKQNVLSIILLYFWYDRMTFGKYRMTRCEDAMIYEW